MSTQAKHTPWDHSDLCAHLRRPGADGEEIVAALLIDGLQVQKADLLAALRHLEHDLIYTRAALNDALAGRRATDFGGDNRARAERELLAPHHGDVPGSAQIESGLTIARAAIRRATGE